MRGLRIVVPLALALALIGAGGVWLSRLTKSLDEPLHLAKPVVFNVAPGTRFARVASELAARGLIDHPRTWLLYARFKRLASAIKAGEYEIEPGTTPRALLDKLVSGQVLLHSFTIVDGWRLEDVLAALKHDPDVVATLPVSAEELMAKLGDAGVDAEGQFLPETYRFTKGTPAVELLRQAHEALKRELDAAWSNRDPSSPLRSTEELLIVASIVEKESGLPSELPKIAGLYLHRLRIGMRLQADPTVVYGLGGRYDGQLHTVDLQTDGPYNTYTRAGLPPTPISLPGAAAIRATAHPEKTDAIYFVASPKGDGSHVFSTTLEEHNAAVARYVTSLRERTGESAK
ncbi:MAG TPA: endolytic transglycosylase MltG [Steroidobacteraceae bacterium]|nr:endolytic transglycosylase MltG [Steroidobacteraceae bacterium]